MPGLNLGTYGGVSARVQPNTGPNYPTSATQAAFGPGYTSNTPNGTQAFVPNDAFGITFWLGLAAIGVLIFIRQSLPR